MQNPTSVQNQDQSPPLLEVQKICLSFGKHKNVVNQVSFKLAAGKTLGLVGESGAGKSSIARAILHLIEADSGHIRFDGKNIAQMTRLELKRVRRRIQIIFQEPSASLSPRRTIAQILLEPLKHFAIGNKEHRLQAIRHMLQTVGLESDILQRFPHQFSSGQQQRIAIARALLTQPDLLIADEAVSALDVSVQAQILQLLKSLQKKYGIALLFVSHDMAVIRQVADDVAVMYRGHLLEYAPADTFFSQAAHPYSKALLSYANFEIPPQSPASQTRDDRPLACVYAAVCAKTMPVCEQIEPHNHKFQHKNGQHCVKCHLYDENIPDDK